RPRDSAVAQPSVPDYARTRRSKPMPKSNLTSLAALLLAAGAASAQPRVPDIVLVNGKIVTVDARSSVQQALAIADGKITALGRDADIRKLAGRETRVIDLGGRTVIPGLIDSHLHAIRAALTFATE